MLLRFNIDSIEQRIACCLVNEAHATEFLVPTGPRDDQTLLRGTLVAAV